MTLTFIALSMHSGRDAAPSPSSACRCRAQRVSTRNRRRVVRSDQQLELAAEQRSAGHASAPNDRVAGLLDAIAPRYPAGRQFVVAAQYLDAHDISPRQAQHDALREVAQLVAVAV